jgi:hypothetical protein
MHQDQSAKPFWIWASVQANNATTHMSIHIIIDGYNLIRNSNSLKAVDRQDMQAGRESLVDMLAMYKRVKSHRITVVFDGPTDPVHSQYRDRVKGIDIKFSRKNCVKGKRKGADRQLRSRDHRCGSAI